MLHNYQDVNEILYNQLNSITKLLNLEYYEKENKIFILNPDNGETTILEKKGNTTYVFKTIINNEPTKVEFNHSYISIEIDNKTIFMDENNLFYVNKEDNNLSYISLIYQTHLCFKKQKDDIYNSISIDLNNNKYNQMIKEIKVKDTTSITNEKIEILENPYTIAKHYIHRYDLNNKMTSGTTYQDDIYIPINDFIDDEINNNPLIIEIVKEMENTLPGIIEYNKKMFPYLTKIIDNYTK